MNINEKGEITLTRGQSGFFTVSAMEADRTPHPLVSGDTVYFSLKKDIDDTEYAVQKVITSFIDGYAFVNIRPEDTQNLTPTTYVYDVWLVQANGERTPIVEPNRFQLKGAVTRL